jgi:N-formylglutamate amidohydrolase
MSQYGMGVVYSKTHQGKKIFNLRKDYKEIVLSSYYRPYHEKLDAMIKQLTNFEDKKTILIDCHSFSNTSNSCDICIGFNDDFSYDEEIVNIVVDEFKKSGYSVGINTPYSNSITPKSDVKYKSVMIEVNKRIYMNENTLQLSSNPRQWIRWFNTIDRIYKRITDC